MSLGASSRALPWTLAALYVAQVACAGQPHKTSAIKSQTHPKRATTDKQLEHVTIQGNELVLDEQISFATNSGVILEESYELLDEVVKLLKRQRDIVAVYIHGHTDARGSASRNSKLSRLRAEAVVAFLREKGVEQALQAIGHGETSLVCTEETDACHASNRRVAFKIEVRQASPPVGKLSHIKR